MWSGWCTMLKRKSSWARLKRWVPTQQPFDGINNYVTEIQVRLIRISAHSTALGYICVLCHPLERSNTWLANLYLFIANFALTSAWVGRTSLLELRSCYTTTVCLYYCFALGHTRYIFDDRLVVSLYHRNHNYWMEMVAECARGAEAKSHQ